ncbi:TPA: hypothetical protein DIC20_01520 [Candidatus Dependentiae bacterium]|nr:MAG: hypothetical protein US03_C0008G0029 [candidate division TM6 bacterium GW2011_GWF2_36_131]KKQ02936.1 MAG: hypothetical protein US13_C0008G0009 [candidate division TM6 bacterium GW2011_GWE2_36_25]KKQ19695.1 MAG: hypothetical protein US32_C0006G0029 [candidate division TM6 bacterium GW2011_GWA2_36_9]HBR70958.1 hypothetical protein [Candidatus Dependentiae bacterium]HCU00365.1 hypothetical protein [Candidatus Dependentiae bacterium]
MKKYLIGLALMNSLHAVTVVFNNDTNATYFALCGDVGSLLEPKKECTCELPDTSWWKKWWNESGVALYKQTTSGKFVKTFTIHPKKGDQSVTILVSDIHRKVRNVEQPFNVRTSKRIVSQPVKIKSVKEKR